MFDYEPALSRYFCQVDRRYPAPPGNTAQPAATAQRRVDLRHIRAVLWDIYGTLCGMEVGDLAQSLSAPERLTKSAEATAREFHLEAPLQRLCPHEPVGPALAAMYVREIEASHARSRRHGIAYPEVVIERVWQRILADCCRLGYQSPFAEPLPQTAYRVAYFFDCSLQRTYFYPQAAACLTRLQQAHLVQGIISNAQFYTPWHLRRLLQATLGKAVELHDIFNPALVLFSYQLGFSKPNPTAFRLALQRLEACRIRPDQTLYVGNEMVNDIHAAARHGIRTVLFAGDATMTGLGGTSEQAPQTEPDAVVADLAAVADMILAEPKAPTDKIHP